MLAFNPSTFIAVLSFLINALENGLPCREYQRPSGLVNSKRAEDPGDPSSIYSRGSGNQGVIQNFSYFRPKIHEARYFGTRTSGDLLFQIDILIRRYADFNWKSPI